MNELFFCQLATLKTNRFALSNLTPTAKTALLTWLIAQFHHTYDPDTLYLIGTDGCHLCTHAKHTLDLASPITHRPVIVLDLADCDMLIDTLGHLIPIAITQNRLLCYPFGVMDFLG